LVGPIRLIQLNAPLPKHRHADAQARQAQQLHNRSSGLSEAYKPVYPIKPANLKSGKPF
jgi:hypothetical protein